MSIESNLDHKRQLAFIAIPKNASLSITTALQGSSTPVYFHKPYVDIASNLDYLNLDYKKFCVCRNPYDRIFSAYSFMLRGELVYVEDIEFSEQVKQFADFNEFVIEYLSLQEPTPCQVVDVRETNMKTTLHFLPQSNWVCDHNYELFQDIKIYRYERLQELEEDLEILLPPDCNSSYKPNYLDVYNEQSKDIIYSMYKYDFVNFGYER
tara:strand:+ start:5833 stop:6459 length:627 start_codon:yes stop_codon:yes gene_type:complete